MCRLFISNKRRCSHQMSVHVQHIIPVVHGQNVDMVGHVGPESVNLVLPVCSGNVFVQNCLGVFCGFWIFKDPCLENVLDVLGT